jgi:hypothetical protein
MSTNNPAAQIGRWYLRWDKGEIFQVTGRDNASRMIQVRTFDGGSDEIAEDLWSRLPLGTADPPYDWAGPDETVEEIDLEFAQPPADMVVSGPVNVIEAGPALPTKDGDESEQRNH